MARKRTQAGRYAAQYGVKTRVINQLGLDKFEAMSEEARQLYIQWTRHGHGYGENPKGYKVSPFRTFHSYPRSCAAAIQRSQKTTADWMELMARAPQWWRQEVPEKKPIQRAEPSEESTERINQLMRLAGGRL